MHVKWIFNVTFNIGDSMGRTSQTKQAGINVFQICTSWIKLAFLSHSPLHYSFLSLSFLSLSWLILVDPASICAVIGRIDDSQSSALGMEKAREKRCGNREKDFINIYNLVLKIIFPWYCTWFFFGLKFNNGSVQSLKPYLWFSHFINLTNFVIWK